MDTYDDKESSHELLKELEEYDSEGLLLWLDGHLSNPKQITQAHLIQEENTYMRDYISDDKGEITGVGFDKVKNK